MSRSWRGALRGLIGLALLAGVLPVTAQSDTPAALRFGIVGADADPAAAGELGVSWELLAFEWAALQPEPGAALRGGGIDRETLAAAADAGREVVGVITTTPEWASESGRAVDVPEGLALAVDDPGNVWAQFVAALVTEYAPLGVRRWLIYDQPDVPLGEGRVSFAGSVEDYARLLVVAQEAAHAVDRGTVIQPGALYWWADQFAGREPYLGRLVAALQAESADFTLAAVTLRITDTTASLWEITSSTRAILAAAGLVDVPIWLLTNAAPTGDSRINTTGTAWTITPDQQADFIMQAAAVALALGVERIAVEQLADAESLAVWGLLRADGSRRPVFDAYRDVITLFAGAVVTAVYRDDWVVLIVLDTAGRENYVVWAVGDQPVTLTITTPDMNTRAVVHTATARPRTLAADAVEWPAAFVVAAPAAIRDAQGFLTVAGAPRVLAVARQDDFFRVVYADVNAERLRLK